MRTGPNTQTGQALAAGSFGPHTARCPPPTHPPASVDYRSRPAEQRGTNRKREDAESRQRDWQTLRLGKPERQEMRGHTERGEPWHGSRGGNSEPALVIEEGDENIVKRRGSKAEKVAQRNQETREEAKGRHRMQECSKCFTRCAGRDSSDFVRILLITEMRYSLLWAEPEMLCASNRSM